MKKEDFHVGQLVTLLLVDERVSASKKPELRKGIVTNIGRKYIRVRTPADAKDGDEVAFCHSERFQQSQNTYPNYKLFLTDEDALRAVWRKESERKVKSIPWSTIERLSDHELQGMLDCINAAEERPIKYQEIYEYYTAEERLANEG